MIEIYRKTAIIKAQQFDPENDVIPEGVFDKEFEHTTSGMISQMVNELQTGEQAHNWHVKTLEGDLKVNPGDWIATGVNGEHWAIADDVFKKTYKELPVIPKKVAEYLETSKQELATLFDAFDESMNYLNEESGWIANNQDDFARAWLDGYTVE